MKSARILFLIFCLPFATRANGVTVGNGVDECLKCSVRFVENGPAQEQFICPGDRLYGKATESLSESGEENKCSFSMSDVFGNSQTSEIQ